MVREVSTRPLSIDGQVIRTRNSAPQAFNDGIAACGNEFTPSPGVLPNGAESSFLSKFESSGFNFFRR